MSTLGGGKGNANVCVSPRVCKRVVWAEWAVAVAVGAGLHGGRSVRRIAVGWRLRSAAVRRSGPSESDGDGVSHLARGDGAQVAGRRAVGPVGGWPGSEMGWGGRGVIQVLAARTG